MPETKDEIIQEILSHMDECGGFKKNWYVGISQDAKDRLINGHGVTDAYIYREAESASVAREVEQYFIDQVGTDGGPGGGDESSNQVYAYKKKAHTNP